MAQQKTFIGLKVSVHRKQPKYSLASLPISTFKKLRKHMVSLEIRNLRRLQLKLQFISDKCYKFGIRGFSLGIADGIAEKSLEGIQVASVPGYFDGMADGPLHSGRSGLEGLRHLGVEDFRDRVDHVHIVDGDDDRLPQVLVPLDMGGDSDLVDDARDHGLDAGLVREAPGLEPEDLPSPELLHPVHQGRDVTGLQHQVPDAQIRCRRGDEVRHEGGGGQDDGLALHIADGLQDAEAVLLAEHQVQHQKIGPELPDRTDGLLPVGSRSDHLESLGALKGTGQGQGKFLGIVCYENGTDSFHMFLSCRKDLPRCAASPPLATVRC